MRVIYALYATVSDPEGKAGELSCVLVIYSLNICRVSCWFSSGCTILMAPNGVCTCERKRVTAGRQEVWGGGDVI